MIGQVLDNKYHLDRQLGAGGMGNVYLATHLGTTRVVAVKVIAPRWASDPQFLARFQREAQACGRLRHPNIVNVTDFGIAMTAGGQVPYLVMELLDGQTLSAFQEENARPPLPLVADILDQVALALDEAHRHGIVHRDLKPDNIWLEPTGRGSYTVKVLDFGVAKMKLPGDAGDTDPAPDPDRPPAAPAVANTDAVETLAMHAAQDAVTVAIGGPPSRVSRGSAGSAGGQTMPGSLLGTPGFMSPEQALGFEVDYRSDIYSFAVVAYSLVCEGKLPFSGTLSDLIEFHRSGTPPAPADVARVPRDVSGAVLAGLARDPADRPPSAIEFARRFHNAVDAEFFALRRSRAFLMQHLGTFAVLLLPIYGILISAVAVLAYFVARVVPVATASALIVAVAVSLLLVFADNVMRATAALVAVDERVRRRRLASFRVFWNLLKAMPRLAATQLRAFYSFGPGWITRDCLWPVVCVVEGVSGAAAIRRSRLLMTGLNSAGRALAIRHLALAAITLVRVLRPSAIRAAADPGTNVLGGLWFPLFAVFSAAALFLYDRTAAHEHGPLLQLDRTPEVPVTSRPLSISSMVWLGLGALYILYGPIRQWLFGGR